MSVLNSLFSAFLMFSKIPMPNVEWKEENRRYSLCFFPLVGAVVGALILLWYKVSELFLFGNLLFSVVCTIIPVLVTGGIHIDGFCDVNDAVSSYSSKEKKLEIMKDPHVGSFAIIKLCVYFLLQTALFSEIKSFSVMTVCAFGFILSRAWSSVAAVTFPSAKGEGSLYNFSKPAQKQITLISEILFIALSLLISLFISPICGISAFICGFAIFVYYKAFSKKQFGGITGDLAGYFSELYEIAYLAGAVLSANISEVVL